jgi:isopenicillin N synthase-like dioxygenase
MDALATELLTILELAVGVEPGRLNRLCQQPMGMLTANWYPALTALQPRADQWRIAPHTDFGTVTVLDREPGIGGLQVQLSDGTWVDAPWVPGSLTINVGDLLTVWSGQRWPSARHRVLAPSPEAPAEELTSLVYFHAPSFDAIIEPTLPSADYLLGKVAQLATPAKESTRANAV